jgi:hypothetical protein
MDYILAPILWLLGLVFSVIWWIVWQILWILIWLGLPLLLIAIFSLRVAERVFGQEKVRAWVRARTAKYGTAATVRGRRLLFALGVVPFRVFFYFIIYAFWHGVVSLLWRPRWSPWQRAWAKRWRPQPAARGVSQKRI